MYYLAGILDYFNDGIFDYNTESLSIEQVLFSIVMVFVLSLVILFTYKKSYQTTVYNRSFAISLPVVAMVTCVIIISVSSNIILSLGMVGALSIVRFRTAIKNPFDTVFMFWAIGLGVTSGAGLNLVAVVSTLSITLVIFFLIWMEVFISSYFLIIRADSTFDEEEIIEKVKELYGRYTLRNKTVKDGKLDLTLEIKTKEEKHIIVNELKAIESVRTVMILSHQGDYISE